MFDIPLGQGKSYFGQMISFADAAEKIAYQNAWQDFLARKQAIEDFENGITNRIVFPFKSGETGKQIKPIMKPKKLTPQQKRDKKNFNKGNTFATKALLPQVNDLTFQLNDEKQKVSMLHDKISAMSRIMATNERQINTLTAKNKSLIALLQSINTISNAGATISGL